MDTSRNLPAIACAGAFLALIVPSATGQAIPTVEIGGKRYVVEIAEDEASRAYGLMNRDSMEADHGMLFVFPGSAPRAFWMKNTKIPLDMLFFDGNRRLLNIQRRVPPCTHDPCAAYASNGAARYVLELNGGEAERAGIEPGAELVIRR
jgi:uncharacterized membrane protein (UPF0127 family)